MEVAKQSETANKGGEGNGDEKTDGRLVSVGKKRTRTGCLNCRRKRRKCDETKPRCEGCQARREICQWGVKLSFRPENAQHMSDEHPSMRLASVHVIRSNSFQIVDVTSEVIRDYFEESVPSDDRALVAQLEMRRTCPEEAVTKPATLMNGHSASSMPASSSFDLDALFSKDPPSFSPAKTANGNDLRPHHSHSESLPATLPFPTPTVEVASMLPPAAPPSGHGSTSFSAPPSVNTPAQPFTIPATPGSPLLDANDFTFLSPQVSESTFEDGIFLPGSQYQELHAQLRNRIIDTARSTAPSRVGSPELVVPATDGLHSGLSDSNDDDEDWQRLAQLSPEQEYLLLQNYIDEVAPWLDKFDLSRHFELVLPTLAKTHAHLKYAILALSARQIERKEQNADYSVSLALYQHAIHLLSPLLHKRTSVVLASCVVLCVLEMLSCSPRAWKRHLDGCAALIQALGISGACGGLDQALFWVFARMDICGGLISSERTLIPMHNWMCGGDMSLDLAMFAAQHSFDMYANQMEYLCGRVVDLLCSSGKWEQRHHRRSNLLDMVDYTTEWTQLFELVEAWYQNRPEEMKALLVIPSQGHDNNKPFPTLYFGNGPATSGNQMYHTAALLMLKYKPAHVHFTKKPQSMLWHARQICAISISNSHHGSWTNSTQPLWIAGQQMSHPTEHKAILRIMDKIERETGWACKWRADDLREYWGLSYG